MAIKCPKCQTDNPEDTIYCDNCAAPLPQPKDTDLSTVTLHTPAKELARGAIFAKRYEVIEELGVGGMGRVYRVLDKKINEEVALKLIRPEIASDRKTIDRFGNELKIARKISHKNICHMYHLSEETGTHYITMEYIPGEDLKSFIRRARQLTVGTSIAIAKQVCEGLIEAHKLGVVHRDLKSSNIMIDKEGNARIMDFGIARSLSGKGITRAGVMIGTPEYMSPEQVEGKDVDQCSDIYSLGIILYEMVTGRVPFEGETPLGIAMKHKSETPKNPKELNAQIPDDLSHLILRCLEKDIEIRYQSAGEVRSELTRIEKGIPVSDRIVTKRKPKKGKMSEIKWKRIIVYGGIPILLILLIVGGIYLFTGRQEAFDSIAVLPLKNLSGDSEQEYFADGMTEALIGELAKISALRRIISSTSVMRYKGTDKSLPEIARELNVAAVVEGSVLLVGEQVRITAQLIEARNDRLMWSDSYERDLRNILVLQKELAKAIARKIKISVTPEEQARFAVVSPVNPEAYQLYLKGRYSWNKRSGEDLKRAIEYFEKAIEKDPNYALAYAGLADAYYVLPAYVPISLQALQESYSKGKEAALKALEIDDTLAEAHSSLAVSKQVSWNWEGAEKEFKKAIELNPGYATAHYFYAYFLMLLGRFNESIAKIKVAQELDPHSLIINANIGLMFYYTRRYDEAIDHYKKRLVLDHDFWVLHDYLGRAYTQKGMHEKAISEYKKALAYVKGHLGEYARLAHAYAMAGMEDEALKVIRELKEASERTFTSSYLIAKIYVALGQKNQALQWLEKAYLEHDYRLRYIKIDPQVDALRLDPRFKALIKKVGLE